MTAIRAAFADAGAPSDTARRVPCNPELAQRRQRDAAVENPVAVTLDFLEERPIDRRHDDPRALCLAVLGGQRFESPRVPAPRAHDLILDEAGHRIARLALEHIGG